MVTRGRKAKRALYESYKRGWRAGAQGKSTLGEIGTAAPWSIEDFRRGCDDGRHAFNEAMKAEAKRLGLVS